MLVTNYLHRYYHYQKVFAANTTIYPTDFTPQGASTRLANLFEKDPSLKSRDHQLVKYVLAISPFVTYRRINH